MFSSPWHYFTDPVLQAPTVGSMLMCLASALVGVIVFLRKRSLVGESLSHAAYPGVVISVWVVSSLFEATSDLIAVAILIGAFFSALMGLWTIEKLERVFRVKNDAALCFVLAVFFGVGILMASRLQATQALWFKTIQIFLYGQAATMTSVHVVIYLVLACLTIAAVIFLYRQIELLTFDRHFAKSVGVPSQVLDPLIFVLLVLAIVVGIRSVGVVLMAGMLIAPAVAARQCTDRLSRMFALAGLFGALSGFLGNYLSVELSTWIRLGGGKFSLPTGPMILLSASSICFVAVLCAPTRGLLGRGVRILRFRRQCLMENLLKSLWKKGEEGSVAAHEISLSQGLSCFAAWYLLLSLWIQGWIVKKSGSNYGLTQEGARRAERIVRLHRLWEVYLVHLGQGVEKVHRSAEEMEHILTPELEAELTCLLQDPKQDPHHQPIPRGKES